MTLRPPLLYSISNCVLWKNPAYGKPLILWNCVGADSSPDIQTNLIGVFFGWWGGLLSGELDGTHRTRQGADSVNTLQEKLISQL